MKKSLTVSVLFLLTALVIHAQPILVETVTTDVSCNGSTDGSVLIRITGGKAPYTYTIQYGTIYNSPIVYDTFYVFSNIEPKDWAVVVQDDNGEGFFVPGAATIQEPEPVSVSSLEIIPIRCTGSGDGEIIIEASGESGFYNYELSPSGMINNDGTFRSLTPGTYTVKITDASGCSTTVSTQPLVLSDPSLITIQSLTVQNPACQGSNDGSISLSGSGGTPPYTYTLNPGSVSGTTGNFGSLPPGNYTVEVSDKNNCLPAASGPITISEPESLQADSVSITPVSCAGLTDGKLFIRAKGGTPPYQYTLQPGNLSNTTGSFHNLEGGNYSVEISDSRLCGPLIINNLQINVPVPLSIEEVSTLANSCNNSGDGEIVVAGSGGTPPYTYTLNPGNMSQANGTFTSLDPGQYTVSLSDKNSCPPVVTETMTIENPPEIQITETSVSQISCNGASNGSIALTTVNGTGVVTYTLNPGNVINTTGLFEGLSSGIYSISVQDEKNCPPVLSKNIEITEPDSLKVSVLPGSVMNLECSYHNNGSINIEITGGTPVYEIQWTGPAGFSSSDQNINKLTTGNYSLTITDANGCSPAITPETEISSPPALSLDINKTDPLCFNDLNGSINVQAQGGTPGFEYSLDGFSFQKSGDFAGLEANTYTLTARDTLNCVITEEINLNNPAKLEITGEESHDNNICYGDSLGEINIHTVSGGILPYTYSINRGNDFSSTSLFTQLPGGDYQTVVRDSNGCLATGQRHSLSQPPPILITELNKTNVSGCYGNENGSISVSASGGTGILNYSLDGEFSTPDGIFTSLPAGNYPLSILDQNACKKDTFIILSQPPGIRFNEITLTHINGCYGDATGSVSLTASGGTPPLQYSIDEQPFSSNNLFTGLQAGNHSISVMDSNACRKDSLITLNQPAELRVTDTLISNITCHGDENGSIRIQTEGGTAPITFTLNPGNISNSSGSFENLSPGNYTVSILDSHNCGAALLNDLLIREPDALTIDSVHRKEILCNNPQNGGMEIFVSGGIQPYSYSVDKGENFQSSSDFSQLSAGIYPLVIEDANHCRFRGDSLIFTAPPPITTLTEVKTDISGCYGDSTGSIEFQAGGGSGSFTYSIDKGLSWQQDSHFHKLTAGNYQVIARDSNSCEHVSSLLKITQPSQIHAIITTTPDYDSTNTGSISIENAGGGTGDLEFSVSGTAGPFTTNSVFPGLGAGSYQVVIRDENACILEENTLIQQILPLDITVSYTNLRCYQSGDGSITLTANDATGKVEYSIDGGTNYQEGNIFSGLDTGKYLLRVRDAEGRSFEDSLSLTQPDPIIIENTIYPASCNYHSTDGRIELSVNGGTGEKTIQWSEGSTGEILENVTAGSYSMILTDENECHSEGRYTIPALHTVIADAGKDTTVCLNDRISLHGTGGNTYSWTPAENMLYADSASPEAMIPEDTEFVLRAGDDNHCYDYDTVRVRVHPLRGLNAGNDTSLYEDQYLELTTTGGPYISYHWNPAYGMDDSLSPNPVISLLQTTIYTVTAETEFGCFESDTITIHLIDRLKVYDAFSPNGDGINDYWDIGLSDLYPDIQVEVFNRWGEKLFSSKGYGDEKRWDGKYKGREVPTGTYYYVIIPYPGARPVNGPLTIVR